MLPSNPLDTLLVGIPSEPSPQEQPLGGFIVTSNKDVTGLPDLSGERMITDPGVSPTSIDGGSRPKRTRVADADVSRYLDPDIEDDLPGPMEHVDSVSEAMETADLRDDPGKYRDDSADSVTLQYLSPLEAEELFKSCVSLGNS